MLPVRLPVLSVHAFSVGNPNDLIRRIHIRDQREPHFVNAIVNHDRWVRNRHRSIKYRDRFPGNCFDAMPDIFITSGRMLRDLSPGGYDGV
jgi:hypothetical protein